MAAANHPVPGIPVDDLLPQKLLFMRIPVESFGVTFPVIRMNRLRHVPRGYFPDELATAEESIEALFIAAMRCCPRNSCLNVTGSNMTWRTQGRRHSIWMFPYKGSHSCFYIVRSGARQLIQA